MSALYIHIPFCQHKCFYCSFAVTVGQAQRMDDYVSALLVEAKVYHGAHIDTVYLGGGTPSLLNAAALARLFEMIKQCFRLSVNAEITLEANPENLDLEKAKLLFGLGVNRISLGIQTFNDKYLKYLGRGHDVSKALDAFYDLRRAGFKNINVDLMYSFPGQNLKEIEDDVKAVLGLGSEHVSVYTLTVEPHSKFYVQKIKEQDDCAQGKQYELVTDLLDQSGMSQYEVSNFSRPRFESKHNINYWESGDYFGLGMSAHSHHDGRRSWNFSRLADYLKKIESGESPQEGYEVLSQQVRLREALVFGLRMNRGVDLVDLERKMGCCFSGDVKGQIKMLIEQEFLLISGNRLQASARGRLLLDEIAVKLI